MFFQSPHARHRKTRAALLTFAITSGAACAADNELDVAPNGRAAASPRDSITETFRTTEPPEAARHDPRPAARAAIAPELPDVAPLDQDQNRIDDVFDDALFEARSAPFSDPGRPTRRETAQAHAAHDTSRRDAARLALNAPVGVEAIFSRPMPPGALEAFARAGGAVRHVFRAVSYGFTGRIPLRALEPLARALGPELLLLKADRLLERHLDEATRTGRARVVWAPGFALHPTGFSGASTITIGIIDTGVDGTHPDLAGRMVGWKDYTTEAALAPIDTDGHGSHVAGIALGSGAAFGMGPGTLRYTDHGDLATFAANDWNRSPVHLPPTFTFTSSATWLGGGTSTLALMRNTDGSTGPYSAVSSTSVGAAPLTLSFTGTAIAGTRYSIALTQDAAQSIGRYAIANSVSDYPAVGDGFPALRGVAAGSGWFGAKIFPAVGLATTSDIGAAMDDMVVLRTALNIKVVNMSFGVPGGGTDTSQRGKANTMVANGIVVVASAGNNGASAFTGDPARAANVITVGATNDQNELTQYTSGGFLAGAAPAPDVDDKPDVLAPGGSRYRSKILSVDSNTSDADDPAFPDARPDDYANAMGTSMAAPFVAGAAALLIEALERTGAMWSFDSSDSPLLVKMLLSASATETNRPREVGTGSPTLGRGAKPKDAAEGFGIVNPDAAIEAVTLSYTGESLSGSTAGTTTDRRAWGRKLSLAAGRTIKLSLDLAATADFDVYLYDAIPAAKGRPTLRAAGDRAGLGVDEVLTWTAPSAPASPANLYVFVKRIAGSGAFTLTGETFVCGDGVREPGEQCDDGNTAGGDCCSATCQHEAAAHATTATRVRKPTHASRARARHRARSCAPRRTSAMRRRASRSSVRAW